MLQVPHRIQQDMSVEATPILSGAVPGFESFMTAWEKIAEKNPSLRRWIEVGMKWATVYYRRMDHTRAYIIAMRKSLQRAPHT